jgi:FAD/FMN-containing dehydrogenase
LRENISEAQKREGISVKHDISLPLGAIPGFLADAGPALAARFPGVRIVAFGHLGDGNLHYNVSLPADNSSFIARSDDINGLVHDRVHALGGSISAEHGIGQLKRDLLPCYKPELELELMRRIKAAFDPCTLMNPGKVL